ncbi:MAG TPA: hypothetical protein VMB50_19595 [Myxococcales bacterium]|nr:hypothetical protein [Myxococcales bacterium]
MSTGGGQVAGGAAAGGGSGCTTCRRTSGAGGDGTSGGVAASGSGGGTSGGASTGSASTGASATGGSSTGGCEMVSGTPPTPFDCTHIAPFYEGDAGSCTADWFGTVITDYGTCQPVCNLTLQLIGSDGLPIAGQSVESDPTTAVVHLCVPDGETYTPYVSGQDYAPAFWAEIQGQLLDTIGHFGVFGTAELALLIQALGGQLDPNKAAALVYAASVTGQCNLGDAEQGWTISLAFEDGGAYPPGSYSVIYFGDAGVPQKGLSATSSFGVAILQDIDPTMGGFVVPIFTKADAGACPLENAAVGYSGRLHVAAGSISEQPMVMP